MNDLTLHYVNQAERERAIAEDLRNRQILSTAGRASQSPARQTSTAPVDTPATQRGQNPVHARAVGR